MEVFRNYAEYNEKILEGFTVAAVINLRCSRTRTGW